MDEADKVGDVGIMETIDFNEEEDLERQDSESYEDIKEQEKTIDRLERGSEERLEEYYDNKS